MKQFAKRKLLLLFSGLATMFVLTSTLSFAGDLDPSGSKTGTINDVPAAKPGEPTLAEVADAVGHSRIALNFVWTLIAGFLVMFMQAGFAMVEVYPTGEEVQL